MCTQHVYDSTSLPPRQAGGELRAAGTLSGLSKTALLAQAAAAALRCATVRLAGRASRSRVLRAPVSRAHAACSSDETPRTLVPRAGDLWLRPVLVARLCSRVERHELAAACYLAAGDADHRRLRDRPRRLLRASVAAPRLDSTRAHARRMRDASYSMRVSASSPRCAWQPRRGASSGAASVCCSAATATRWKDVATKFGRSPRV